MKEIDSIRKKKKKKRKQELKINPKTFKNLIQQGEILTQEI